MQGPPARSRGATPASPPSDDGPVVDTAGLAGALAASRGRKFGARRQRLPTWAVVAIGVVAAVALSLLAVGVYHALGVGSGGSGSGGPASYYGDLGPALSTAKASYWSWPANGEPGLVFAEGLVSPSPLGPAVSSSHLGQTTCAPTLISSAIHGLPSYGGPATAGAAPEWLYAFQATGNELVVVAVVNGSGAVVATTPISGTCYTGPGSFTTIPVDSSVASAAAAATKASTRYFDNATANASVVSAEFFLAPPGFLAKGPAGAPVWVVTDTTCVLYGGPSGAGSELTSVVNAGTGALFSQATSAVTC